MPPRRAPPRGPARRPAGRRRALARAARHSRSSSQARTAAWNLPIPTQRGQDAGSPATPIQEPSGPCRPPRRADRTKRSCCAVDGVYRRCGRIGRGHRTAKRHARPAGSAHSGTVESAARAVLGSSACAQPRRRGAGSRLAMISFDETGSPGGDGRTTVLAAISDEMGRLYKDQFGRGPNRVRTYWCGNDIITTVLEDTLTPAERNLALMGEHQRLRDTRMFFQYATVEEFCEPIERLTGRKVRSFHSSIDTKVDGMSVETFILYPPGYSGPSRRDLDTE